jgi:hypothetical protein
MKKVNLASMILIVVLFIFLINSKLAVANSDVSSSLEVTSPTSDKVYSGRMPLNFTIFWNVHPTVAWIGIKIGYIIDDGNPVFFPTEAGAINGNENFTIIEFFYEKATTEAVIVDVSALGYGEHNLKIVLLDGSYNFNNDFVRSYSNSFPPISFTVDNSLPPTSTPVPIPTPSPEPTIPISPTPTPFEEPKLGQELFLGVAITLAVIGVGLGLLLYLIKRK